MQKIRDEEVLAVLRAMKCDGTLAQIAGGQLEHTLYAKVNKVLEACGGKWNRKFGGHTFPGLAAEALATAVGEGTYHDAKKEDSFFETPPELAAKVVKMAEIESDHTVLEPSAGRGALVQAVANQRGCHFIIAVERNPDFVGALQQAGASAVYCRDFLEFDSETPRINRIVMNPPFSADNKQCDIDHVMKAWSLLSSGGILVAIMSRTWLFGNASKNWKFRGFVATHGSFEKVASGTFEASGTNVGATIVKLRKP